MSEPIRTLIADDEPLARRQLRSLLERDPQIALVGEAGSGAEARRAIRELKPELLLLDVRMPQGDGFSVLEDLERPPYVIFATAHAEHAVHAFDVAAVDYLLKPFDDERFGVPFSVPGHHLRAQTHATGPRDRARWRPQGSADDSQRITVHDGKRVSWSAPRHRLIRLRTIAPRSMPMTCTPRARSLQNSKNGSAESSCAQTSAPAKRACSVSIGSRVASW